MTICVFDKGGVAKTSFATPPFLTFYFGFEVKFDFKGIYL